MAGFIAPDRGTIKIGGRELQADIDAIRASGRVLRPGTSLTAEMELEKKKCEQLYLLSSR